MAQRYRYVIRIIMSLITVIRKILIFLIYGPTKRKSYSKADGKWQRYNKVIKVIIDSVRQSILLPLFPVPNKIPNTKCPSYFFRKNTAFSVNNSETVCCTRFDNFNAFN